MANGHPPESDLSRPDFQFTARPRVLIIPHLPVSEFVRELKEYAAQELERKAWQIPLGFFIGFFIALAQAIASGPSWLAVLWFCCTAGSGVYLFRARRRLMDVESTMRTPEQRVEDLAPVATAQSTSTNAKT